MQILINYWPVILIFVLGLPLVIYIVYKLTLPATARHEAGHALIAWILPYAEKVYYATCGELWILKANVEWQPTGCGIIYEPHQLSHIAINLAGDASETLTNGKSLYLGSDTDRKRAVKLAESVVRSRYRRQRFDAPPKDQCWNGICISSDALKVINHCWEWDIQQLTKHRVNLDTLIQALTKHGRLETEDLAKILGPKAQQKQRS